MNIAYPDGGAVDLLGLFHVAPATVVQLVGALVPLLVAVIVKRYAEPWVKVATNLVATAVVASIALLATADGHYAFATFWAAFVDALIGNVVAYLALWRKTLVRYIEERTGDLGLGTNQLAPVTGDLAATSDGTVIAATPAGPVSGVSNVHVVRTGSAFDDQSDVPPLIVPPEDEDRI